MFLDFIISGHRGVQSLYRENTLDSFQAAIDLGLKFVELDLLATQDGEIVIHHDFSIDERPVRSISLEELRKIDCGSAVNPDFPMQQPSPSAKIPLLKELFEMVKNSTNPKAKKLSFNLEIKSDPKHPEYTMALDQLAKKIVSVVTECGFQSRVYYSSFDPKALSAIHVEDPKAVLAFLYQSGDIRAALKICEELKAKIFSPQERLLNPKVMQAIKDAKLLVIPWTVNDPARFKDLVAMGVDGIITDYPQNFL